MIPTVMTESPGRVIIAYRLMGTGVRHRVDAELQVVDDIAAELILVSRRIGILNGIRQVDDTIVASRRGCYRSPAERVVVNAYI